MLELSSSSAAWPHREIDRRAGNGEIGRMCGVRFMYEAEKRYRHRRRAETGALHKPSCVVLTCQQQKYKSASSRNTFALLSKIKAAIAVIQLEKRGEKYPERCLIAIVSAPELNQRARQRNVPGGE